MDRGDKFIKSGVSRVVFPENYLYMFVTFVVACECRQHYLYNFDEPASNICGNSLKIDSITRILNTRK